MTGGHSPQVWAPALGDFFLNQNKERKKERIIPSSCLGDEWAAGLVLHQELLRKQGRAPEEQLTWMPGSSVGQAWGLQWKKILLEIEVREHSGTVGTLSRVTLGKRRAAHAAELSSAQQHPLPQYNQGEEDEKPMLFLTIVQKSHCFASKLSNQP